MTSAALGANPFVARRIRDERHAAAADLAGAACRDADDELVVGNVVGDYGACANHGVAADRDAADDRRVRADRCAVTDERAIEGVAA